MANKTPFGLLAFLNWNHDWNDWHFPPSTLKKAIKQLKDLGSPTIRTEVVWSDINKGLYQYDFARYDRLLSLLADEGFEMLVTLHYNKERTDASGKEIWNVPPQSFEEFARYVNATVKRYKNRVHHWEIWNEPNHPGYWTLPPDGLKTYTRLLDLSYHAAKEADPSCRVMNGGITEPVLADVANFYANGGKNLTDILSIHTFVDPTPADAAEKFQAILTGVRKIMEKNGDGSKPVWITEMGCPGVPANEPQKAWFAGGHVDEAQQAKWLEIQYKALKNNPFVEKIFWAFYRDTGNFFKEGADNLGIVRSDLTPKPSYYRMKKLIQQHGRKAA